MPSRWPRLDRWLWGAVRLCVAIGAFVCVTVIALIHGDLLLRNSTDSVARGFYVRCNLDNAVGYFAKFCTPPERELLALQDGILGKGSCPAGSVPLLKRIVAKAGDAYSFTASGVYINGNAMTDSTRLLSASPALFPPPVSSGILADDEWIVLGDGEGRKTSFDSRYFGPVTGVEVFCSPPQFWHTTLRP